MRRYCDSFHVFVRNARRAQAFLRAFDAAERGPGATTSDDRQLLRGTVVFMVGTLDAFLHDLVIELAPLRAEDSGLLEALREITKADPTLPVRMVRASNLDETRELFAEALDLWISSKSFQGPAGIRKALGLIGCPIGWETFDDACGVDASAELELFREMRNAVGQVRDLL